MTTRETRITREPVVNTASHRSDACLSTGHNCGTPYCLPVARSRTRL